MTPDKPMTEVKKRAVANAVKVMNELGSGPINDVHLEQLLVTAYLSQTGKEGKK